MEIICEKEHCTGCTACAVSCPKNAISMAAVSIRKKSPALQRAIRSLPNY